MTQKNAGRPRVAETRKKIATSVALTPDVRRWLLRRAREQGLSASAVVGLALREAMVVDARQRGAA
jgi:hypothetical protein